MSAKYYRIGRVRSAPPDISPEELDNTRERAEEYLLNLWVRRDGPPAFVRVPVFPRLKSLSIPELIEQSAINIVEFEVIEEPR